jgi:hypothetical protein|tara:strand:- start:93 stop:689 length:597 start_codon:yes stop_codon:yes gene_type:complete
MASSIETTSTTTTLKNNGNNYLSVDTNDVVSLNNPLPLASGGSGAVSVNGIVQIVNVQTGAVATGTTAIPYDDTIPQNTEGDEFMTLAITPKHASNKLKIDVVWLGSQSNSLSYMIATLFQDSTAGALAAGFQGKSRSSSDESGIIFTHYMAAGTTSETTFKVRAGAASGTTTFNGHTTARTLGGVVASSITITEYSV